MIKALVTGGAGFIGTNLIRKILSEDSYAHVVSIDNYFTGKIENHVDGAIYIKHDIRDKKDYNEYGSFDVVFHLAAVARIQPSFKNPVMYFETNANGTLNICEFCYRNKIPLVYAGSSSHHYGKFKNPYTFSKDIGEEIVNLYQINYNLFSSIARFYNVYGPNHLKFGEYTNLIGRWEGLYEQGNPLKIYGNGEKRRDFTHVEDIVDGLLKIYQTKSWNYVFELGRGCNYSVSEIAKMFNHPIEYGENLNGEADQTLCNSDFAKKILGWNPQKNVEDYIKSFISKK
jgi:UDP-glucose 4-epimerase